MKVRTIATLLLVLSLAGCRDKTTEDREELARRSSRPEAVLVETVMLEPGIFYHELISNGKVTASGKVVIPFRTAGTIVELNIRNGQWVRAGDTLARIEDFAYVTALTRARNRFEKAEAEHNIYWTSRNALSGDTSVTGSDREKMQAISSGLTEARIALAEAEYNLRNTRIVAPISGRIANLEARLHNHSSSFREFCTIISDEVMDVVFPVIESEYRLVAPGMPVGIVPFANDTMQITGTITEINPAVSESGMIQVKANFRNNSRLIEGMNVRILIRKPEPGRLVVPKEALVMRQGRDVIFIRQDSLAIWRYVDVEFENSSSLSIRDGLAAGDLVIVKGNINLSHETIVKEDAR